MIPATSVRALVDAFEQLDVPRAPLVAAARVDPARFEDPDALAPCTAFGAIVAAAQRYRPRPDLALAAAQVTPIGAYPLLDYLVVSSADVGEALRRLARYYRLVGAPTSLEVESSRDFVRVVFPWTGDPFGAEYAIALCVFHLRRETGGRARPLAVHFHHRPEAHREIAGALECAVKAGESWSGFILPPTALTIPMRRSDAALVAFLEPQADAATATRDVGDTLIRCLKAALLARLDGGRPSVASIARSLALTTRTLQRRLAAEGLSFQRVLDDLRRANAERHLRGTTLSIAEISFLLGFSEPAAFHRAFRRWHGTTPQSFRGRSFRASRTG
jgi:AraC-like DNA-binding protein